MNRYVAGEVTVSTFDLGRACYPMFSWNLTVHTEGLCLCRLCRFVSVGIDKLCAVWNSEGMSHCRGGTSSGVACENPEAPWLAWSRVSHDLVAAAQTYAHSQSRSMPALRGLCRLGQHKSPDSIFKLPCHRTGDLLAVWYFPQECSLNLIFDESTRQKRCIKSNIHVGLGIFKNNSGASPKTR